MVPKIFLGILLNFNVCAAFHRSALIYNVPNRPSAAFQRHLMRINTDGSFSGQWLFDAAILTSEYVNGKGVYTSAGFTGQDYVDYLNLVFGDARSMNSAMKTLATKWGRHPTAASFQIFIGMPYPNPVNGVISINGQNWDLNIPVQRLSFGQWYADEVQRRSKASPWYNFNFGIYYHLEEAVERTGDVTFLTNFNNYVHSIGMKTVWVPFFDSEGAWNGSAYGFDYLSIQPRLSFLSPIDGGNLHGDRLYSTGLKCASQGCALEYESRSQGVSELEYSLAHQYLAVSEASGSSTYSQVFFVGGPDIFDKITSQSSAPSAYMWMTYQDLANYLRGDLIQNWEVAIPWNNPISIGKRVQQITWTCKYDNINSIRIDFSDFNVNNPWRGKLVVMAVGSTSFAVRVGPDSLNVDYNSVFVPMSNIPTSYGTNVTIQLRRYGNAPWPNILRLIGGTFEQKYIANSIFGEASSSSNPAVQTGSNADSLPTHLGTGGNGKLTDGQISPTGDWWWGGQVGWNLNENDFTVTIDLGVPMSVSGIRIYAYKDPQAGIQWPEKVGAFLGSNCPPAERGDLNGCVPISALGKVTTVMQVRPGSSWAFNGTLTGQFGPKTQRGRYVTVTAQCRSWCILDEIQLFDSSGKVISTGKTYRVTPVTGEYNQKVQYADNSQLLVDGVVFTDFIFYGKQLAVGLLLKDNAQFVQAVWTTPRTNAKYGSIWITRAGGGGIGIPSYVNIQWRNENLAWTSPAQTKFTADCGGGCPCARILFSPGSLVTGIKGMFPVDQIWVMVTEISIL